MIWRLKRFAGIFVVLLTSVVQTNAALPHFKVKDFGAACDGRTDDTAAIQRTIDAAAAAGGGLVEFTDGTYLLNTANPSSQPDHFYNLKIGSNVRLKGATGTKLLQGPGGRHSTADSTNEVHNTVLAVGSDYATLRFQNPELNGGFFALVPTVESNLHVMFAKPSDSAKFAAGDYVAIYNSTNGDGVPVEITQVKRVSEAIGALDLTDSLARSFDKPVIANVTKLVTTNIAIFNLTIQGAEPLAVTETVFLLAKYNQFVFETPPGSRDARGISLMALKDFRFEDNIFFSFGENLADLLLAKRSSANGYFVGNRFIARSVSVGDYSARITIASNTFNITADPALTAGIALGGENTVFVDNDIKGGNLTGGSGTGAILTDVFGTNEEPRFAGGARIAINRFHVQADGNACIAVRGRDTSVTENKIVLTGSGAGIRLDGRMARSCHVLGNSISTGSGDGIAVVRGAGDEGNSIVSKNVIVGGGEHGIYVTRSADANPFSVKVSGNATSGYKEDTVEK